MVIHAEWRTVYVCLLLASKQLYWYFFFWSLSISSDIASLFVQEGGIKAVEWLSVLPRDNKSIHNGVLGLKGLIKSMFYKDVYENQEYMVVPFIG